MKIKEIEETRKTVRRSTRLWFTLVVMAGLALTFVVSTVLAFLLSTVFHTRELTFLLIWFIIFNFMIGYTLTFYLGKLFFGPITKLSEAMRKVSEGNFDVRLETKSPFGEMKEMYSNFNLMTRELGATEILQTDFVSNVSHEFKTPINAIEGYATLLQCNPDCCDEERIYTEKILFNTKRLSTLVGNILLLSKVDNKAIRSNVKKYRLDEQIRQSVLAFEREWDEKEIELDIDLDEIEFEGNENLMFHVWNNLIANAVKFNPKEGLLKIRLFKEEGNVICTVEDSGPGIPEDSIKHIFDKFYQSDSSHKEEGNGLGLALVKNILTLHGGEVFAKNRPEGGAKFTVIL
ncbi:MAG: HAMP domain-containing histidine kinase [Oscillospiraceae bacterium]|nr:HAMP domain-containing histidine kinase [Oscillospiraceae bacterium]